MKLLDRINFSTKVFIGFGVILDLALAGGFGTADQFRFSFGAMALLMACCAAFYAFSQHADDR